MFCGENQDYSSESDDEEDVLEDSMLTCPACRIVENENIRKKNDDEQHEIRRRIAFRKSLSEPPRSCKQLLTSTVDAAQEILTDCCCLTDFRITFHRSIVKNVTHLMDKYRNWWVAILGVILMMFIVVGVTGNMSDLIWNFEFFLGRQHRHPWLDRPIKTISKLCVFCVE